MIEADRDMVREFVELLGYEDVSVKDSGVLDFGRVVAVTIFMNREVK